MTGNPDEVETKVGIVFEIQRYSTEDGPGIRTTVFFKQCPLKCAWCQNPESIDRKPSIQWFDKLCIGCKTCVNACPEGAISFHEKRGVEIDRDTCVACGTCVDECPSTALKLFGREWTLENLVREVLKDKAYYDTSGGGVTVSGGEPAMQPDFVATFLERCKREGVATAFDTCGATSRAVLERMVPHVDLFLYDIKEIDPGKHEAFTGMSNAVILDNCDWLARELPTHGKSLWIRTPVIPGYTATPENIRGIARFIVDRLDRRIDRWDLLAFNNLPGSKYERMGLGKWVLDGTPLLTREELDALVEIATQEGVTNVAWSGLTA